MQAEGAAHICAGTGLTPPTSAPGLGSPDLRLHRDWAHPCHICAGTGPTPTHICAGIGGCVLQVEHRKTFLFLEQIILKYHAQARPTQSTRSTPSSLSTLEYSCPSPSEWQVSAPQQRVWADQRHEYQRDEGRNRLLLRISEASPLLLLAPPTLPSAPGARRQTDMRGPRRARGWPRCIPNATVRRACEYLEYPM